MATSLKLIIDDRRSKSDGTFPIVIRLTHNRVTRYIQTGFFALSNEWLPDSEKLNSGLRPASEVKIINQRIAKKKAEASDIILDLEKFGDLNKLSASDVKAKIENRSIKVTFSEFTGKIIQQLKTAKKYGNASVYQQALDFLARHTGNKEFYFDQITFSLIKHLETQHLANKKSLNSLSFYLRTIRSIYNRAIKEGIAKRDNYPFLNYSIKETKTQKRAIRKTDIDKIKAAVLESGSALWHTRNVFLFSFYNMGMNLIDIAFLKLSDINNGRINYKRAKTGKAYSIKLTHPVQEILSFYTKGKKPDDFVFSIINAGDKLQQLHEYRNFRRLNNKWLKRLAKHCGIDANLTSYVSRHSWATIAKDLNVPVSVISEGLGHEDIKTTQIYLDEFDDDVIDKANELITA